MNGLWFGIVIEKDISSVPNGNQSEFKMSMLLLLQRELAHLLGFADSLAQSHDR